MNVRKALITAAGKNQRTLPLQTLVDRDGAAKSVLRIIVEESLSAGVEEVGIVISPGDEAAYASAVAPHSGCVRFIEQKEPRGYGHAVACGQGFLGDEPFLLLVGDHVYISRCAEGCARQLVTVAKRERASVSAVQPTHETKLPYFGAIGGKRLAGTEDLYEITEVREKPTPTEAEQHLIIPGLRAGHYLCFFGMHVLTPGIWPLLSEASHGAGPGKGFTLSSALAALAHRERYLAYQVSGRRYDVGAKYGVLTAQLAVGMEGRDRDEILGGLVELLADRRSRAENIP